MASSSTVGTTSRGQKVEVFDAVGESASTFQYSHYGAPDAEDERAIKIAQQEQQEAISRTLVFTDGDENALREASLGPLKQKLAVLKAKLLDRQGFQEAQRAVVQSVESKQMQRRERLAAAETAKKNSRSTAAGMSGSSSAAHLKPIDAEELNSLEHRLAALTAKTGENSGSAASASAPFGGKSGIASVASEVEGFHRHVVLLQPGVANELAQRVEQMNQLIQHYAEKKRASNWSALRSSALTSSSSTTGDDADSTGKPKSIESSLTILEKDKLSAVYKQLGDLKTFPELLAQQEKHLASLKPLHDAALEIAEDIEYWLTCKPFNRTAISGIKERCDMMTGQMEANSKVLDESLDKLRKMMAEC